MECEEDVVEDRNVAWARAYVDVDLAAYFEVSWRAGVGEAPDLVCAQVGDKDLAVEFKGHVGVGRCSVGNGEWTAGESVWKRSGSPGTVATKEQLGDPNYYWIR